MPRVKPYEDPREADIRREIGGILGEKRITVPELAKRSGINERTLRNRIKNAGTLRLSEYWAIQDVGRKK